MPCVQIEDDVLWVRCWDGTEMEFDCFHIPKEIVPLLTLSNHQIARRLKAVPNAYFDEAMRKVRVKYS